MTQIINSSPYNYRDVLGISPVKQWTDKEIQIHKNVNRVLSAGFSHRSADEMIQDAKLVDARSIAEICCPSIEATLTLHLAKEMAITFKVLPEDIGTKASDAYTILQNSNADIITQLNTAATQEFNHRSNTRIQSDQTLSNRTRCKTETIEK